MPAVSQAQRAFIYARFGKKFAQQHHFDNPGPLPKYAHNSSRPTMTKRKLKRKLRSRTNAY